MRRPERRHVVLAILLCASAAFLVYSLVGGGSSAVERGRASRQDDQGSGQSAAAPTLHAAAPDSVDLKRYQILLDRDVFSAGSSRPQQTQQQTKPLPVPPLNKPKPKPAAPKPAVADFSGWSYVGYVVLDGTKIGLLQHESSNSCEYRAVGEEFLGAKVEAINGEDLRLKAGSSPVTLSRERDFGLLPLDKPPQPRTAGPEQATRSARPPRRAGAR
jgi:hypothetical protein